MLLGLIAARKVNEYRNVDLCWLCCCLWFIFSCLVTCWVGNGILCLLLGRGHTYFTRILLSSFFRCLISELAERNSAKIAHILGSNCDSKTHLQNLAYPLPLQVRSPKTTFLGQLCNLTATLTAYIFGMKHDIDNRSSTLTTKRGLLHRPKMSWTMVHKPLESGWPFLPTLCKFCFLRHCEVSQMEISKQNSTTLCQTVDGKSR